MAAIDNDNALELPPFSAIQREAIKGTYIDLIPLDSTDAQDLWPLISGDDNASLWTYMPVGPFHDFPSFQTIIASYSTSADPLFWTIVNRQTHSKLGYISFLRIDNANRTIEIGHVLYTRRLQKTTAASEAWFLLARKAFTCGYRRLEWKCNAKNEPSKRAALRYGHAFEGIFRQHMLVKGRNRDTAWFSIVDGEWEAIRTAFEKWLEIDNFDEDGRQKKSLTEIREETVKSR